MKRTAAEEPARFSWRAACLIAIFLGLAGLEVVHGVFRLNATKELSRRRYLTAVERVHTDLAHDLEDTVEEARLHAAYLARWPAIRESLESAEARRQPRLSTELEGGLRAYTDTFSMTRDVRALDAGGAVRWIARRDPDGILVLNAADGIEEAVPAAARALVGGQVAVTEVPELGVGGPRTLDVWASAGAEGGAALGWVVLGLDVDLLFSPITEFSPISGVAVFVVDEQGDFVAADRSSEAVAAASLGEGYPGADAKILAGQARAKTDQALFFAQPTSRAPDLRLVTVIPNDVLAEKSEPVRTEYLWVIGMTLGTMILLALAGAFFYRLSLRSQRLRQTELYLTRIRRESAKYRALMEAAADMILIVDRDSEEVLDGNDEARERLGSAWQDLTFVAEQDRADFRDGLRQAVELPGRPYLLPELSLSSGAGVFAADARFVAIDVGDERLIEISIRDLTQRKTLERQLQVAERLSSLGLLTAGVAHEINNPLEGIGNYLALLELEDAPPERRKQYLAQLRHGFQRIRDTVYDLLRFARPDAGQGHAVVSDVIERALGMVRYSKEWKAIRVQVDAGEPGLTVAADPGSLEQVLLNLLLNAANALGATGKVWIRAGVGQAPGDGSKSDEPDAQSADERQPREVYVTVEDDGPGVAPADQDRIFDPFFTTGEGTGLGLSISYSIVDAMGGRLSVENRHEGGASFTIRLLEAESVAVSSSKERA